ncbi:MAG: hypothetical protein JSW39_20155 [Desulfobacterales bacterium]|nr:MAG: hypothetical protein JSW39_20155 [Desulfobacterales bacterium]
MTFLGPFNSTDKTKFLKFTYLVTIALLLSAVVFTPVFIRHYFLLFKKYIIQEDAVEAVLIIILLLIAYLLSNIYKKELKKYRQETRRLSRDNSDLSSKLTDAFKYIGGVNVQIQEIRSIFCGLKRYPTTENEFRKDLALFARKVLGIVNADWVVIRIIGQTNLRTMKEHLEPRKNANCIIKGISNKAIVANRAIDGYSIVATRHDNSMIMVVCVFPKKRLDEEEKILVEAITNQIEMLYLIKSLKTT